MIRASVAALIVVATACGQHAEARPVSNEPLAPAELVVRMLDVKQGDATLIENGTSRVLIDGAPEESRMRKLLDSLALDGDTIDVVILTHQHSDHLAGLRALFDSRRHIAVRFFFENQDVYTGATLRSLRDSVIARQGRRETVYRDTDDPCANGRPVCTITMNGGAKLHIMRPLPSASNVNDRSVAVKLVAPDSASFSMWLAGDAERDAIDWFLRKYKTSPGMRVDVLKADHHGSCNGVTDAYLDATHPALVVSSVGAVNGYGHMHTQAKTMYRRHKAPWYRTDQNGAIEIRVPPQPGAGYTVTVQRGRKSMSGPSDKRSTQSACK
jgi:competence protein ComEC